MARTSLISTRRVTSLRTFSAFEDHNFKLLWSSNVLSYISRWMQIFLLSLFILDRTDSPFLVALVGFFGMAPMLLLGVFGGVLADRMDRRKLLIMTQSVNLFASIVMAGLLFSEVILDREIVAYWHAYIVLTVAGTGWALDMPSRRSIVLDLLGKARVTNGIAVDSIGMQSSMMIGPILAGALISTISFSGGYVVVASFHLISVILMGIVRVPPQTRKEVGSHNIARNLMEGFRYVRSNETIFAVILITILMNMLLFSYQQMVPVVARNVLNADPWKIGILMGAQGFGSLVGGVLIASASNLSHHGRVYLGGSMLGLLMLLLFSFSRWYAVSLPILMVLGLGSAGFGTMQSTIVILAARDEMRSRALGVITLAIGTGPLGSLIIGAVASATSPSIAMTINASIGLVVVGLVGVMLTSLRRKITSDDSPPPEPEPASPEPTFKKA